jgi:hypothetical protein
MAYFQNKSQFITEDQNVKHMYTTIFKIKSKWNYLQKIIKGAASLNLIQIEMFVN